jgi:micrococcal nuclease
MYEYNATILNVVDGDTVDLCVDLGLSIRQDIRVRFARINAPEIHRVSKESPEYQRGIAAMRFVQDFAKLTNNKVRIVTVKDKKEAYGRYLAEIYAV